MLGKAGDSVGTLEGSDGKPWKAQWGFHWGSEGTVEEGSILTVGVSRAAGPAA